jgi:hypothetical protein
MSATGGVDLAQNQRRSTTVTLSNHIIASSVLSTIFVAPLAGGDPSLHDMVFDGNVAQSGAHQDRALGAYRNYVDREWAGKAYQHSMTREALTLLMNALDSVAQRRELTSPQLTRSMHDVRPLIAAYDAGAPDHVGQSARLQRVFLAITDVVERLVDASGLLREPIDPRLSALRRSAESLDLRAPLRRQPDVIERFFHHAGEALYRISEERNSCR